MSDLRYKNQLVERLSYVFGVLLLSGILGVIVSIIANYFVLVVKWFANLRTVSNDFFSI
jgi:H+/Cl- antiporter ClcA